MPGAVQNLPLPRPQVDLYPNRFVANGRPSSTGLPGYSADRTHSVPWPNLDLVRRFFLSISRTFSEFIYSNGDPSSLKIIEKLEGQPRSWPPEERAKIARAMDAVPCLKITLANLAQKKWNVRVAPGQSNFGVGSTHLKDQSIWITRDALQKSEDYFLSTLLIQANFASLAEEGDFRSMNEGEKVKLFGDVFELSLGALAQLETARVTENETWHGILKSVQGYSNSSEILGYFKYIDLFREFKDAGSDFLWSLNFSSDANATTKFEAWRRTSDSSDSTSDGGASIERRGEDYHLEVSRGKRRTGKRLKAALDIEDADSLSTISAGGLKDLDNTVLSLLDDTANFWSANLPKEEQLI